MKPPYETWHCIKGVVSSFQFVREVILDKIASKDVTVSIVIYVTTTTDLVRMISPMDGCGRLPLPQVIQQVIQQIIQLFWSFWVGVTDCCMTFRDQNSISTTSEHVQMLQRLRPCCMSHIKYAFTFVLLFEQGRMAQSVFIIIVSILS